MFLKTLYQDLSKLLQVETRVRRPGPHGAELITKSNKIVKSSVCKSAVPPRLHLAVFENSRDQPAKLVHAGDLTIFFLPTIILHVYPVLRKRTLLSFYEQLHFVFARNLGKGGQKSLSPFY